MFELKFKIERWNDSYLWKFFLSLWNYMG